MKYTTLFLILAIFASVAVAEDQVSFRHLVFTKSYEMFQLDYTQILKCFQNKYGEQGFKSKFEEFTMLYVQDKLEGFESSQNYPLMQAACKSKQQCFGYKITQSRSTNKGPFEYTYELRTGKINQEFKDMIFECQGQNEPQY